MDVVAPTHVFPVFDYILERIKDAGPDRLFIECLMQCFQPEFCHEVVRLVYENEHGASNRSRQAIGEKMSLRRNISCDIDAVAYRAILLSIIESDWNAWKLSTQHLHCLLNQGLYRDNKRRAQACLGDDFARDNRFPGSGRQNDAAEGRTLYPSSLRGQIH